MNYDWCWADMKKSTWSYCKKSKVSKPKAETVKVTSPPVTTTTKAPTTTTTTTTRRVVTTRPTYTKSKQYTKTQSPAYKGSGTQLQQQIMSNVETALQKAVFSSQQDIRKIDQKMGILEDNILVQEQKIQKLDRVEQMQRDTNQTLTQITKWIRYLSSSVEDLNGMKKKVDILAKESERQRNSGFNTMYKNALRSNEIDNNSISSPIYNYQRKGPSASPVSSSSRSSSSRPMVVLNMPQSLIFFHMTGFLTFALSDLSSRISSFTLLGKFGSNRVDLRFHQ